MSVGFYCPRCRVDQSVGANVVAVYPSYDDGFRMTVACPDCTTTLDTPCDGDTVRAVVRLAAAEQVAAGMLALELDVAGDLAPELIGRRRG